MNTPSRIDHEPQRCLRTVDEIAAAGAEAVEGWCLSDEQCEQLAACVAEAATVAEPEQERRAA